MFTRPQPGLTGDQLRQRIGCLTASQIRRVLTFKRNGEPSEDREAYKRELVAERLTDIAVHHYVTPAMQHGIDNEDAAKAAYTEATGNAIEPMPTLAHPSVEHFLATPDGRIAPRIGIEFKCPTSAKFVAWKLAGVVPEEHKPQMIAQCLCAGFDEVEFVAFDPRMPEPQRLFIRRYAPTAEEREAVLQGAVAFLAEVDAMFDAVVTA